MVGLFFKHAGDSTHSMEEWEAAPTWASIMIAAREYLECKEIKTKIVKIELECNGKQFRPQDISEHHLAIADGCTIIVHTGKFTLNFVSGSNNCSHVTPRDIHPIEAAIRTFAKEYLANKQSGSVVTAVHLKKHNGPACNLDKIPAAELPEYNNGTVIVYTK